MNISKYNVIWDSQSKNSGESMPVGGFDTGANVWVENNNLYMYIDRSGSFDENNQMLKLGRFRISFCENLFKNNFKQTLLLEKGRIEIEGDNNLKISVWFEVDRPAGHIEVQSDVETEIAVSYESWRTEERIIPMERRKTVTSFLGYDGEVKTLPDTIEPGINGLTFYHRNNPEMSLFDMLIKQQCMESVKNELYNPEINLTFGGKLIGGKVYYSGTSEGCYAGIPYKSFDFKSTKSLKLDFVICLHNEQVENVGTWKENLNKLCDNVLSDRMVNGQSDTEQIYIYSKNKAEKWWSDFWNRSYIDINGDKDDRDIGFQISRNYALFRYMLGINAYGDYPTKFNGGLLITDPCYSIDEQYSGVTPEYRDWGGGTFTAQNQRLVYWPMLKNGDFDMLPSQFNFYRRLLKNAELRTKVYWGHEGCSFVEQIENNGFNIAGGWGFDESTVPFRVRAKHFPWTESRGPWTRYGYSQQLEFAFMIIKYYQFTGKDIEEYIPFIESSVRFFIEHYQMIHFESANRPLNGEGKLVILPSTSLETYKDAVNPTEVLAGLKALTDELIKMPQYVNVEKYKEYAKMIPDIKIRIMNGVETISPAYYWSDIINIELPQLYPVFPYELLGIGKPELELAVNTYKYGVDNETQRGYISWHQDGIFAARLGLTDEAKRITILKLKDSGRRFPAFWGPGHDWVPDHNWGGSGMIGLQDMLVQFAKGVVYLFAAWPKEWDVKFKLNLPGNTVIEASLNNGEADYRFLDGDGFEVVNCLSGI